MKIFLRGISIIGDSLERINYNFSPFSFPLKIFQQLEIFLAPWVPKDKLLVQVWNFTLYYTCTYQHTHTFNKEKIKDWRPNEKKVRSVRSVHSIPFPLLFTTYMYHRQFYSHVVARTMVYKRKKISLTRSPPCLKYENHLTGDPLLEITRADRSLICNQTPA